jgi:hypothetical protein
MGKRSLFPHIPQDAYPTPAEAVAPLLGRLAPRTRYIEPCAGEGRLIEHLERAGHVCVRRYDLPDDARVKRYDVSGADGFITNAPWTRSVLHPIIVNLSDQLPTWLLLDAAWIHTQQSAPYLARLRTIVSVGRVKWIENSPFTGKHDCAWLLFDRPRPDERAVTHFIGRTDIRRAELVRTAVLATVARKRERRSAAAKQAAETRPRHTRVRVFRIARRIVANQATGPARNCYVCGKSLTDAASIERGIGSECWQHALLQVTEALAGAT